MKILEILEKMDAICGWIQQKRKFFESFLWAIEYILGKLLPNIVKMRPWTKHENNIESFMSTFEILDENLNGIFTILYYIFLEFPMFPRKYLPVGYKISLLQQFLWIRGDGEVPAFPL